MHRVIESIQDEGGISVDPNHLKALNILEYEEKEIEEPIDYLKSLQFRERLIVDYLNVLEEQNELLEIRKKIKSYQVFPKFRTKSQNQRAGKKYDEINSEHF